MRAGYTLIVGWRALLARVFAGTLRVTGFCQPETHQLQNRDNHLAPHQNRFAATLSPCRRGAQKAPSLTQIRHCSRPQENVFGQVDANEHHLAGARSPSAHCGPRSLPMSWCTPWKITLRSVPFMLRTPFVAQHAQAIDVDDGAEEVFQLCRVERPGRT